MDAVYCALNLFIIVSHSFPPTISLSTGQSRGEDLLSVAANKITTSPTAWHDRLTCRMLSAS